MATEIIMPKMGESITEGTIVEWKKKVGDKIEKDETILEISTDKVDSEVPSPSEGILIEITVDKNRTVDVGTVIGYIGESNEKIKSTKEDSNAKDNDDKKTIANEEPKKVQVPSKIESSKPRRNKTCGLISIQFNSCRRTVALCCCNLPNYLIVLINCIASSA